MRSAGLTERTAHNWRALAALGMTAEQIVERGGMRAVLNPWPEIHEVCKWFPPMQVSEYAALKASIERWGGILEPIDIYEGKVLDGKERMRACRELGIEPVWAVLDPDAYDPIEYTIRQNIHRRHMNESQRAVAVADIAAHLAEHPKDAMVADYQIAMNIARRHLNESQRALMCGCDCGRPPR